ncbi:metal-dependent hydrolase [Paenibacillus sp. 276b]|uniref:metal-dependent hydrolase n=1 Tax=Paenibacillus sp. 276b TaxID=1566277 RepID=UPI000894CA40|nr:metal-dependent hydrolase [Paenibacillus sp. 276b]SEB27594.1 inner membrane protein [Paenibacillus sp. 276b]
MYAKTHMIAGGIVGYLISPTWVGVLGGAVSSLLSDIDEPKSFIGRKTLLLSVPLNWAIEHRTVTHSLLFAFVSAFIFFAVTVLTPLYMLGYVILGGIISHIVGDMLTGRVMLFWPMKKKIGIKMPFWIYRIVDMLIRLGLIYLVIHQLVFGNVFKNLLSNSIL